MSQNTNLILGLASTAVLLIKLILDYLQSSGHSTRISKTKVMAKIYDKKFLAYEALLQTAYHFICDEKSDLQDLRRAAYAAMLFMNRKLIRKTDWLLRYVGCVSVYRDPSYSDEFIKSQWKQRNDISHTYQDILRKLIVLMARDLERITPI